jgi:hypothetical protein
MRQRTAHPRPAPAFESPFLPEEDQEHEPLLTEIALDEVTFGPGAFAEDAIGPAAFGEVGFGEVEIDDLVCNETGAAVFDDVAGDAVDGELGSEGGLVGKVVDEAAWGQSAWDADGKAAWDPQGEAAWDADSEAADVARDEYGPGLPLLDELLTFEVGAGSSLGNRVMGMAALAIGPTLRKGDKGPAVAALQRALSTLGHPVGDDGDFGSKTVAAVRAFQAAAAIDVDGAVGPQTKRAILDALARRNAATPVPAGPTAAPTTMPTARPAASPAASFRNEWASEVLGSIRSKLAATGHSPETWWDGMVAPVWLGRRFRNGIHEVLLRKLQAAEAHLRRLPAYASLSDAELGRALGLREDIGGARTGRSSMHSFGLAVDVEYTANPWILGNPAAPISNKSTRQACNRAALLVGGRVIDTAPPFLSSLARGGTAAAYDRLRSLHLELVAYLGLAGNPAAARTHVARNAAVAGVMQPGESTDAAAVRWAEQARADLARLRRRGSNFHPRDPLRGFLSLDRDLVIALRDSGRLAWGAIDFGEQSGDIMHFDARPDGVGQVVYAGIRAWARRD